MNYRIIELLVVALSFLFGSELVSQESYVAVPANSKIDLTPATLPRGLNLDSLPDGSWSIRGSLKKKTGVVVLKPSQGTCDISSHSYLRLSFKNAGAAIVWIRGRLDNHGAQDWANSTASCTFILPGETATLGFPFPRPWEQNDAPEIFNEMSAKPNGHRTHWKQFNPKHVTACRLQIRSADNEIALDNISIDLERPYGIEANKEFAELPFLDPFGQVRNLDWESKVSSVEELKHRNLEESQILESDDGPNSFNQYGGWKTGPSLDSTGFFRITKRQGKWWFVDPAGKLFFSNGINTIGFHASTPVGGRKELFEWLPTQGQPMFGAMIRKQDYRSFVSFIRGNVFRTFEKDWMSEGHARIRQRLKSWGINTIGAWSDKELIETAPDSDRVPYTGILHIWRKRQTRIDKNTPDPYAKDFANRVSSRLQEIVDQRGHDPWCVGMFIDNEIEWHDDLVPRVFAAPATQPAKIEFVTQLKRRYKTIGDLNAAWRTGFSDWTQLEQPQKIDVNKNRREDFEWLYGGLAEEYYKICRDSMRKVMPNHLYLGSRIHKCPRVVARAAAKFVDVYSINSYVDLANRGSLPADIDKPVLIAEFHFAAPGRGLGVGLSPVGNRLQRSRAYAAFVTNGICNPNVVGTHWFAYADQSAAGRPYENYQIGFVDVTDTPYPMISEMARNIADRMYPLRASASPNLLKEISKLCASNSQLDKKLSKILPSRD